ncbi:MAG: tRNA 2-thiouridine(34) synthase MnmA [Phycisphaerales bacterium]
MTPAPRKPKVLLAMSGGVDSSVAAALLQQQGYDVVGVFMRLGSPGETIDELQEDTAPPTCDPRKLKLGHQGCCSVSDAADARLVAAQLGIPFYVVNFRKDFGRIMDYFAAEYAAGRTPNPCVRCNDWLKFGKLHDYARQIDADYVASGHYARVENIDGEGGPALLRGLDHSKDQSYVLFGAQREKLTRMLLPIGGLRKTEVRAIAERLNLPVFNKPDSQEICFVPDNDYAGFVSRRLGEQAPTDGDLINNEGEVVGTHAGHHRFTIGQRRGLGVSIGLPLFVTGKNPAANTVTVGPREDLLRSACTADQTNWLTDPAPFADWHPVRAKFRSTMQSVPATARKTEDGFDIRFDTPAEMVTPGQAIVLYDAQTDTRILAGGWIRTASR